MQESEEELNARLRELKGMDKERQKTRKLTKAEQEEENLFKKNKGAARSRTHRATALTRACLKQRGPCTVGVTSRNSLNHCSLYRGQVAFSERLGARIGRILRWRRVHIRAGCWQACRTGIALLDGRPW